MLYDEVSLTSDTGLSWVIQLSRHDPAKWWETILRARPVPNLQSYNAAIRMTAEPNARSQPKFVPQSSFTASTGREIPAYKPNASQPLNWRPRAGWGTVRGYRIENSQNGRVNLSFYFVPDDDSQPRRVTLTNTAPMSELGEYARGVMQSNNFTVKVSIDGMAQAESIFQRINRMDLSKRKAMFANRSDIDGDAGWSWTSDYTLMKVAPGLLN
jgi:hypothetical protein